MANQMLKPYSFLLYFLAFITCFFIGISYAGLIEAGKGQMLAGGAIVLGYGVMGALIGFVISLFVAKKLNRKIIIRINIILALSIIGFYGYYHLKFLEKRKARELEKNEFKKSKTQTPKANKETALFFQFNNQVNPTESSGLGMFKPHISEEKPLYFYSNPNLDKSLNEHFAIDSITFKKTEYGNYDIATAPPWLVPNHLKLDYDLLYFKIESLTEEFIEITVNTITKKTAFVSRYSGNISLWPEFLLQVNNIEFLDPENQNIYIKPLRHASTVTVNYSYMKPIRIKQNWMQVNLLNDNFNTVSKGWIKWIENSTLLIAYSLLS